MTRDARLYLNDILESIEKIQQRPIGRNFFGDIKLYSKYAV
jgi:uncharacterized protein with HEPN domain